jgi:type II secretory pathway pseudopilin PulG
MSRLRSEHGFTLIETLVAGAVGLFILTAAGGVLMMAQAAQKKTAERITAVQNGRTVMDLMTRQLRSQVCLGHGSNNVERPAIDVAEPDRVVFFSSLSTAPTVSGQLDIDQHTLRFVPSAGDPNVGRIEQVVTQGLGTPPDMTFPGPTRTTVLVNRVSRPTASAPIFRYWKYSAQNSPVMTELATPVPLAERQLLVRVDIAFDSYPDSGNAKQKTAFADQAFVRTADPTDPEHSPKCI